MEIEQLIEDFLNYIDETCDEIQCLSISIKPSEFLIQQNGGRWNYQQEIKHLKEFQEYVKKQEKIIENV